MDDLSTSGDPFITSQVPEPDLHSLDSMLALLTETRHCQIVLMNMYKSALCFYLVYSCNVLTQLPLGLEPLVTQGTIFENTFWPWCSMHLAGVVGFILRTCKTSVTFPAPRTLHSPSGSALMTRFYVHGQIAAAGERFLTNIAGARRVCVGLLQVLGQVVLGGELHPARPTNKLS